MPALVTACAHRWDLTLEFVHPGSTVSIVVFAVRRAEPVVLKVQYPHRESAAEATALAAWDGDGAVRLIDHDADRHALLLERCHPGTHLSTVDPAEAMDVLIGLVPRLWVPPVDGVGTLADEAWRWHRQLGEGVDAGLVDPTLARLAADVIADLADSGPDSVMLHQDLHGENVIAASREPWLAIDPKPLVGERAFGIAPIVRSWELGHARDLALGRLDRLVEVLDLDAQRAAGWAFASRLAWSFDERGVLARQAETARWLASRL